MDPINLNQADQNAGSKGSLIGIIIVIVVLVLGAFYLFSGRIEAPTEPEEGTEISTTTESATLPEDLDNNSDLEAAAAKIDVDSLNADAAALDEAVNQ